MHGTNIFHRCRKLVLKRHLHEAKQNISTNIKKNRETDDKIVIYELKSLVSIVNTNLLLWNCTILKINHFASALHKDILYRNNLKAIC